MTDDLRNLLLDLWAYATGDEWGETTEEDACSESERLGELYERVAAFLREHPETGEQ